MITVSILDEPNIAVLEPSGPLSREDFEDAKAKIDPVIEYKGRLDGLVVHTREFPGWEDFAGLVSHLKFVHDHHDKIGRIAFVTDSSIGKYAEPVASHFVNAIIKSFVYDDIDQALAWVSGKG